MDGVITDQQLVPSNEPGESTFTVTGEDVSVMMDLEEKSVEHLAQTEAVIVPKLIAGYARYGLVPVVVPPAALDVPLPIDRTPVQQGTDLAYLTQLAQRHGYIFYVSPGPAPFMNLAYWGPPKRVGVPQRALSINMGPESNVDSLTFRNNSLQPTLVEGQVRDRSTNQTMPVRTVTTTRTPLASQPALLANRPNVRHTQLRVSGPTTVQAFARAQGVTDVSVDAVTVEGQMDGLRYGGMLKAGGVVGVRGAGLAHDGVYYVKRVTHTLSKETYTQKFTLTRDGRGSLTPVVQR
jgi:phage protein D